jgi:hypothetical protein
MGTSHPIEVFTDHKVLTKYRQPQKIGRRVARYLPILEEYNMTIKHRAGAANKVADALSRPLGTDEGSQDNQDVVILPDHLFVNAIETRTLTERVQIYQQHQEGLMKEWSKTSEVTKEDGVWQKDGRLVVPEDETLR